MNVIFIGLAGSGKGTQSEILENRYGLKKLSTGDLLREIAQQNTDEGKRIKQIIDSGKLVDDHLIIQLIKKSVNTASEKGFIFDGFPRTLSQAEALEKMLRSIGKKIDYVIKFNVNRDELIQRISGRYSCKNCGTMYHKVNIKPKIENICDICGGQEFIFREDDSAEAITRRFEAYLEQTAPVLPFYKRKGIFHEVNGEGKIDDIANKINLILEE
jgi:adenylate kinase